jgi:hypothetical protein
MSEVIYAIRRADGEQMGDYTFWIVPDETDWTPADEDGEDGFFGPAVYEMVRMDVEVLERRTLPVCREHGCVAPARFWGLCEPHARVDDPEYFADYIDNDERDGEPA